VGYLNHCLTRLFKGIVHKTEILSLIFTLMSHVVANLYDFIPVVKHAHKDFWKNFVNKTTL